MSAENDLKRIEAAIKDKMAKVIRAGAINTFQNIIIGSPVDSGRFRANWQASVNAPKMNILFEGIKAKTDSHGKPIKNQFNSNQNIIGDTAEYTIDGALYLTNNLPYAVRLEEGWSQQRGAGWVASSVMEGKQAIKDAIGKL